ncbi:alpha-tocopherol transfer protein-like [Nasonia vitripennis]|uniref:CRAL-TRIO domain-containing protein n=1 Tax=Nasonia vitripennis TaxID=7425 RepID=A0A7M7G481_NASVI|nr:alpha-tocopherol transfer protein-like [Nasonia vitripennis]XP_008204858.1 alpha-tocopherol transfer protein-like [Nasonia vitripennis]XP_016838561.1 alpha-tocopherol transfer protein-like [Nasonia vitripennis]
METLKRPTVEEEFKRNPELTEDDMQHLRDWIKKQPHYPNAISDEDIVLFLHSNYYRMEPTKATIENFLTCRTHVPEFFSNRDPIGCKELRTAMGTVCMLPLEQRTPEGYGVLYTRLINFEVERFFYYDTMRLFNMIADLWVLQHGTMKGHILICDIQGVTMSHVLRIPPIGVKKFLYYLQEAAPIRLKALHYLNTSSVMDFILGLMKPFMKKELMDMLHLHPSVESMKKHMPTEILPNEAGGKAGATSELYEKVLKNLEDHRQYFLAEEKETRVDESLRPGKAKSVNDLFGIEGSFKKLDID